MARLPRFLLVFCLPFLAGTLIGLSDASSAGHAPANGTGDAVQPTPPKNTGQRGDLQPQAGDTYGKLPLGFETNEGQTDRRVKFLARGPGYQLFLTPAEAVLTLSAQTRPAGGEQK